MVGRIRRTTSSYAMSAVLPVKLLGQILCAAIQQCREFIAQQFAKSVLESVERKGIFGCISVIRRLALRPPKWIRNIVQDEACRPKAPNSLKGTSNNCRSWQSRTSLG
jgi:hypothetical protein